MQGHDAAGHVEHFDALQPRFFHHGFERGLIGVHADGFGQVAVAVGITDHPFADQRDIVDLVPFPTVGPTYIRHIMLFAAFKHPREIISHDFAVYGVPPVKADGRVISSTWVREAVAEGRLAEAETLLGRRFSVMGMVKQGRQLGRQLGFPTANVATACLRLPPAGVYVCEVRSGRGWQPAVGNLGHRPTVENDGALSLEVDLLDWQGDLYGQSLEVRFCELLRGEQRFDGLEALKAQIAVDVAEARAFFTD